MCKLYKYLLIYFIIILLFIFYLFRKYTIAWEDLKTNLKLEKLTHEKDIELNNLKQEFFTNISHDIRTPVTLILGSINRLVKGKNIEETMLNPIETIRKNGIKLVNLINELLDYRKFEFGKIKKGSICKNSRGPTKLTFFEDSIRKKKIRDQNKNFCMGVFGPPHFFFLIFCKKRLQRITL